VTTRQDEELHAPVAGLDKLLEHRARLAICVLLLRNDALSFARLKELLEETDGSLGAHLRKLEDADYVALRKEFRDRKPITWYRLRPAGRAALRGHLDALSRLIQHARIAERTPRS
jgi:DNA-binding transcriptional ArsR family regulator